MKGKSRVICQNNQWSKWTFHGWKIQDDQSEKIYEPGDKVTITDIVDTDAPCLIGVWTSETISPHTVTYQWDGLPTGNGQTLPSTESYYETQTYTVDSKYAKNTQVEIGNTIYQFSGWKIDGEGEAVSGEQTMGSKDIVLKGEWENVENLLRLTISTTGCDDVDKNQRFLFRVTGNDLNMVVSVPGNGSTTISGLWAEKTYTVTELTDWAWRYEPVKDNEPEKSQTITLSQTGENKLTFHHNRPKKQWLDGNAFKDIFKKTQEGA